MRVKYPSNYAHFFSKTGLLRRSLIFPLNLPAKKSSSKAIPRTVFKVFVVWEILEVFLKNSYPRSVSKNFLFFILEEIFRKRLWLFEHFDFWEGWFIQLLRNCQSQLKHIYKYDYSQNRNPLNLICLNSRYHQKVNICSVGAINFLGGGCVSKTFSCFLSLVMWIFIPSPLSSFLVQHSI